MLATKGESSVSEPAGHSESPEKNWNGASKMASNYRGIVQSDSGSFEYIVTDAEDSKVAMSAVINQFVTDNPDGQFGLVQILEFTGSIITAS